MIRLAALLALLCGPVVAQNTSRDLGVTVTMTEPQADGRVGEIVHHNRLTIGTPEDTFLEFETEYGRVTLHLLTTENSACAIECPDTLEVWELPEGIIADALEVTTPERGMSAIGLYRYTGP